jgi:hypothetical protein
MTVFHELHWPQHVQADATGLQASTVAHLVPVLPGKKQEHVLEQAVPDNAATPRRLQ